jgi:Putative zincin peptidase
MILWFLHLLQINMNLSEWIPFIRNDWFRNQFMKFVYLLQKMILLLPFVFGGWPGNMNIFVYIFIGICVFVLHECLHIIILKSKGDISLTFKGFFWLNTNAVLTKTRFWIFMSLPLIVLSVIPFLLSFYVSGNLKTTILFIGWINLLISASDIINSVLFALKPKNTVFCRGYYRLKT